jgi:hypothetical protein
MDRTIAVVSNGPRARRREQVLIVAIVIDRARMLAIAVARVKKVKSRTVQLQTSSASSTLDALIAFKTTSSVLSVPRNRQPGASHRLNLPTALDHTYISEALPRPKPSANYGLGASRSVPSPSASIKRVHHLAFQCACARCIQLGIATTSRPTSFADVAHRAFHASLVTSDSVH